MDNVRQIYRSHHWMRSLSRKIELKKNKELVEKNKRAKILVILHMFYPKSWKEIREYLENLSCYDYDLIITVTKGMINENILNQIKYFKDNVNIIECENKGFDLRPFLVALNTVDLEKYDIVIKLQSKSTKRTYLYIYDQLFMRRDWFLDLYEGVLSSKVVHKNIDLLLNDESVGLIAANNLIVHDPWHKVQMVQKIAKEKQIYIPDNYKFVAGTCFAIKAECLKNIKQYPWSEDDFNAVPRSRGMSFAYFFERYICTQVESVWNKKLIGTDVRKFKHLFFVVPNKILYHYSAYRLLDENLKFDPEFFYWLLDNRLIRWKYDEIAFKDIYYRGSNGRRLFIENEPYQYLKGNIAGYKKYCERHIKEGCPVMSIEKFEKLRQSIEENGYDNRNIIIVNKHNELVDGQHRAACLCYKMGEEAKIRVLRIQYIDIKEKIKKISPSFLWRKINEIKIKGNV